MEYINLDLVERTETAGHSSKGNQLKWRQGDIWYKADYMGYEGMAEVVISDLLEWSDAPEHVRYEPVMIQYGGKLMRGCQSRNFLKEGEELVTADRLFRLYTGKNLTQELARLQDIKERVLYLVENMEELTGLRGFGAYLTAALEIDAVFLNEDRHTNNIAVIYNNRTEEYRLCPYFDHGLSLFSDTVTDYTLDIPVFDCWSRIKAKPFSRDFDDQLDAAEELYKNQIHFWFGDKEIRAEMEKMEGIYPHAEVKRVETVLYQQKRKYGYLFGNRK